MIMIVKSTTFTRLLKYAVILCVLLLLTACNSEKLDNVVILTVGDSIGNGHRIATPWPDMIRAELGVPVNNHSVSGEQTAWGVGQIDRLLNQHQPHLVLILLGANDAVHSKSLSQSLANLQTMIDASKQAGADVYVSTLLPITAGSYFNQRSQTLSDGIKKLKGAHIVDARAKFTEPDELLKDGLHPNLKGQKLIAEAFLDALSAKKRR